jgi:hypothetical protein
VKVSLDKIALGITDDEVLLCSHLIHFWRTDDESSVAVGFSSWGSMTNLSTAFCSDTMNRTIEFWRFYARQGANLDRIIQEVRFVILRRESSATATLASIEAVFSKAVDKGAMAIRYLTTLEWDRLPYPAGVPTG